MGRAVDLGDIRKRRDKWFEQARQFDAARNQKKAQLEAVEEEVKSLGEDKLGAISRWLELNDLLADMDPDGEEAKMRAQNGPQTPNLPGDEETPPEDEKVPDTPAGGSPPAQKKVASKKTASKKG